MRLSILAHFDQKMYLVWYFFSNFYIDQHWTTIIQCTETRIFICFFYWKYKKYPQRYFSKLERFFLSSPFCTYCPNQPKTANPFWKFGHSTISLCLWLSNYRLLLKILGNFTHALYVAHVQACFFFIFLFLLLLCSISVWSTIVLLSISFQDQRFKCQSRWKAEQRAEQNKTWSSR